MKFIFENFKIFICRQKLLKLLEINFMIEKIENNEYISIFKYEKILIQKKQIV